MFAAQRLVACMMRLHEAATHATALLLQPGTAAPALSKVEISVRIRTSEAHASTSCPPLMLVLNVALAAC
jgi:hypothetical protein